VAGLAVTALVTSAAGGQEACSCTDSDPSGAVELAITASEPVHHSMIGPEQETPVVDLRGQETVLVGEAPQLLDGVSLDGVPVLMAVVEGSANPECNQDQPPDGSDLSLTGHVYREETGPVVWTGLCQGTLTIVAPSEPDVAADDDDWGRGLTISAVVLAGLAVLCLALVPLTAAQRARRSRREGEQT